MSELRKILGIGALALLPIACCIGLPLLVAVGVGAAAFVWGGAIVGGLVLLAGVAVLRARRRAHMAACRVPPVDRTSPQSGSERREEVVQR